MRSGPSTKMASLDAGLPFLNGRVAGVHLFMLTVTVAARERVTPRTSVARLEVKALQHGRQVRRLLVVRKWRSFWSRGKDEKVESGKPISQTLGKYQYLEFGFGVLRVLDTVTLCSPSADCPFSNMICVLIMANIVERPAVKSFGTCMQDGFNLEIIITFCNELLQFTLGLLFTLGSLKP